MSTWTDRPVEAQRLLNPSFCSLLLWHAALAHEESSSNHAGIPLEECFLILPIVLNQDLRESLPTMATSLPVWLERNPLAQVTISDRGRALVPFTKEALSFGGTHALIRFEGTTVRSNADWKKQVRKIIKDSDSEEVSECAKRAEFLGKWFARTGNAETVLAFFGIQP